jgi:hypothetical protein
MDKNNVIKLVSIDTLRYLKKPIDKRIHSVPALYLLDTKKILFGKEVFDYLILQNKFAFSGQNTRDNKKMKDLPDKLCCSTIIVRTLCICIRGNIISTFFKHR